ncbi:UNVERIFIED_CONTAM: hypothetical protein RMT77_002126 [Armadillidium vulgare]
MGNFKGISFKENVEDDLSPNLCAFFGPNESWNEEKSFRLRSDHKALLPLRESCEACETPDRRKRTNPNKLHGEILIKRIRLNPDQELSFHFNEHLVYNGYLKRNT